MQIESINPEHTVDVYKVAFNLSFIPSDFFMIELRKLSGKLGNLNVTCTKGNNWIFIEDNDQAECISQKSVDIVNDKLQQIKDLERGVQQNRKNMLKEIAESTGVPLPLDSIYDHPDFPYDT